MEKYLGCLFTAAAGRDKDKNFLVVGIINEDYVYIADGKTRKTEKPKKKKLRHLRQILDADDEIIIPLPPEKFTNRLIREKIKQYEDYKKSLL